MSSADASTMCFARSPRLSPRHRLHEPLPDLPMTRTFAIFRRELRGYFATPLAYVFIVIFLVLAGVLTFFVGNFFERGQADLQPFFTFHPWLYLVLIPALSMRLWAEERRSGTIELFLTLPIRLSEAVIGKFLAAWCFAGIALLLTFPFWITVNVLGDPDNGVILAGYLASWLMAGAVLAIGAAVSAMTKNQVIAFVVTAAIVFVLAVAGTPVVLGLLQGWASSGVIRAVAGVSLFAHFAAITRGVLDLRDLVYFASIIVAFLAANAVLIDLKKAD
jgi:ABC-2 type transport system permease protein